jgi:hypothetical protein
MARANWQQEKSRAGLGINVDRVNFVVVDLAAAAHGGIPWRISLVSACPPGPHQRRRREDSGRRQEVPA